MNYSVDKNEGGGVAMSYSVDRNGRALSYSVDGNEEGWY